MVINLYTKKRESFLKNINQLSYASSMKVSEGLVIDEWRYWEPTVIEEEMTINHAIEGFRHYLNQSMRIRLRSDVPISFSLSGGIDSASLASLAVKKFNANIHTFQLLMMMSDIMN